MGRRQEGKAKKKPSDYGHASFRGDKAKIERLMRTVREIELAYRRKKAPDTPYWFKGDIIIEALEVGLPLVKKRGKPAGQ